MEIDLIASISLVFSVIAIIIASRSKRYEFSNTYYNEILEWYKETIIILMSLKSNNDSSKHNLLCNLSAQIEIGRFYFPNKETGDKFGEEKFEAYKGYRNCILDFLVYLYQIYKRTDSQNYIDHIETLQKLFTSYVFINLKPKKHNKHIKKNTYFKKPVTYTIEELIKERPETVYAIYAINNED